MKFTVKSGYWVATHLYPDEEEVTRPPGSLVLKRKIWRLNIIPKIKHFLWKVISGALPTSANLCLRGVRINPICQRCCQDEESMNHILFLCPHATAFWRCSGMFISHVFSPNLEDNILTLFEIMESLVDTDSNKFLVFWITWMAWKSRNEFIFKKRNVHPIEDVRRAIDPNMEWFRNVILFNSERRQNHAHSSKWIPSYQHWLKCNFDCSASPGNPYGGLGWILRDDVGKFMGAGSVKIKKGHSSLEGEAQAFLYALQQIWTRGWRNVWFEGDNQELCSIINQVKEHVELGNLINEIRHWMNLLLLCSLAFDHRERNQAADITAYKAATQSVSSLYFHSPPSWLIKFLYYPFTI